MAILLNGPILNCSICNLPYKSTSTRSKYCSKDCSIIAKKQHHTISWKKWQKNHPDRIKISSQRHHINRGRNRQLLNKYGKSEEDLQEIVKYQNFKCKICDNKIELFNISNNRQFLAVVDHNHKTGQIRGLLCPKCNKALGLFMDSKLIIKNAYEYLEDYETQ